MAGKRWVYGVCTVINVLLIVFDDWKLYCKNLKTFGWHWGLREKNDTYVLFVYKIILEETNVPYGYVPSVDRGEKIFSGYIETKKHGKTTQDIIYPILVRPCEPWPYNWSVDCPQQ